MFRIKFRMRSPPTSIKPSLTGGLKENRKQRVENVENYRNSFALLHQLPPSTLFPSYCDAQPINRHSQTFKIKACCTTVWLGLGAQNTGCV